MCKIVFRIYDKMLKNYNDEMILNSTQFISAQFIYSLYAEFI